MKTQPDITETESSIFTRVAGRLRDLPIWPSDEILSNLINPQGFAGFSGLKKLIEKEYTHEETVPGIPSLGVD